MFCLLCRCILGQHYRALFGSKAGWAQAVSSFWCSIIQQSNNFALLQVLFASEITDRKRQAELKDHKRQAKMAAPKRTDNGPKRAKRLICEPQKTDSEPKRAK
jgi:hypothetical protein